MFENEFDGELEYMPSPYVFEEEEENERPKPTKEQIKKFCEENLCKHCFYYHKNGCKSLKYGYLYTSEFYDHELVNLNCLTLKIKPEECLFSQMEKDGD